MDAGAFSRLERMGVSKGAISRAKLAGKLSPILVTLFLALSAYFLFSRNPFLLISALILALASIRLPYFFGILAEIEFRKDVERGLGGFLAKYAHFLGLGLNPAEALEEAASGTGRAEELARRMLSSARKGESLEGAVLRISESTLSEKAVCAFSAVSAVLAEGYDGSAKELLDGTARGLILEEENALEKHSADSQVVFVSIVFVSAVVPALAGVVLALSSGPAFLAPLLFLGVFPLAAIMQYLYVRLSSP